jgi:hypothetical protein
MRLLCVGRHLFLSEHFCRLFRPLGVDAEPVVGLDAALALARQSPPDAVVCDYDLLATSSIEAWEREAGLRRVPLVAVSMTRRPDAEHLLDINAIAGFFYLPTLSREDAARLMELVQRGRGIVPRGPLPGSVSGPRPTPTRTSVIR